MSLIRQIKVKSVQERAGDSHTFESPGLVWNSALGRLGRRQRGHRNPVRGNDQDRRDESFRAPSRSTRADEHRDVASS